MGRFDPDAPGSDPAARPSSSPGRFVPGSGDAEPSRRFAGYVDDPHTGGPYVRGFKDVGLKREMAERVMGRPATEVYDVESESLQAGSSRGR